MSQTKSRITVLFFTVLGGQYAPAYPDLGEVILLSDELEMPAEEVARAYRRRWNIEVFFRFLKQELNLSHLVSLNQNSIQVMLYMTLILAMLLLIYKKANAIGNKTAKRRFAMEV